MAMHIAPKSFYPPPQVRSAVMIFSPAEKYNIGDWRKFEGVVRGAFRQRRKLLRNNLSDLPGISKDDVDNVLEGLGLAENIRAEQISIEEFIKLAEALPNIT